MPFEDHDHASAEAQRTSIVRKAERSEAAKQKAATQRTDEGFTVESFRGLLSFLGSIVKNWVRPAATDHAPFVLITTPNEHQRRVFDLLNVPIRL